MSAKTDDIDENIEKGNWGAVGILASILASASSPNSSFVSNPDSESPPRGSDPTPVSGTAAMGETAASIIFSSSPGRGNNDTQASSVGAAIVAEGDEEDVIDEEDVLYRQPFNHPRKLPPPRKGGSCSNLCTALIVALVISPFAFGLGFGLKARNLNKPEKERPLGDDPVTAFLVGVSSDGGAALEDPDSPQRAALDWLLSDPLVDTYPELVIEQRYALATLYHSTDGDNWRINTDWLDQELSECKWLGIVCSRRVGDRVEEGDRDGDREGRKNRMAQAAETTSTMIVNKLQLFELDLAGTIPSEVFLLTDTTEFSLYNNTLTGTIPEEVADMTALLELELDGNDLTGTIPEGIFTLTGLTKVRLEGNGLTGTLSSSVGNLANCEIFRVDSNDMSGPIPEFLTFMSSLNELRLNGNGFTGTIPASLGGLSSLDELTLQDNDLVGEMPDEICDLDALVLEADCGGAEPEVECSARCCTECFPQ